MSKTIYTGGASIQIGLGTRNKHTSVVRIDGKQLTELFAIPATVPNVGVKAFDYMIDPLPTTDDVPVPGQFHLVAFGSTDTTVYTVTWIITWNPTRRAFDIAPPQVVSRENRGCEACDA
jgi:hypothetical protein